MKRKKHTEIIYAFASDCKGFLNTYFATTSTPCKTIDLFQQSPNRRPLHPRKALPTPSGNCCTATLSTSHAVHRNTLGSCACCPACQNTVQEDVQKMQLPRGSLATALLGGDAVECKPLLGGGAFHKPQVQLTGQGLESPDLVE